MKISIMQPTYLPWPGYFALLISSDIFVFLDDVQFDRRSWQSRNLIYSENGDLTLSIPVLTKGKRSQRILDVELYDFPKHRDQHLRTLKRVYAKSPFFSDFIEVIEDGMQIQDPYLLTNLNTKIILNIVDYLRLKTRFVNSSSMPSQGQKSVKLIQLIERLKAQTYLTPNGSKEYILADSHLWRSSINIQVQEFTQEPYFHFRDRYAPNRSIVDLLFNLSREEAINYMEKCNNFYRLEIREHQL